ncbi:hypothetical protein BSM4216_2965 [Bacillus smithii]|nr:hypothetical protein BSM4216_2965 [Bacillus smithii]
MAPFIAPSTLFYRILEDLYNVVCIFLAKSVFLLHDVNVGENLSQQVAVMDKSRHCLKKLGFYKRSVGIYQRSRLESMKGTRNGGKRDL